jgi:putative tricarboxylic transport membrane protein
MRDRRRGHLRSPQDFAAGLFLAAVGCLAIWQGADLPMGSVRQMGPGMLPRALAVLTILCGLAIATRAIRFDDRQPHGAGLERWSVRAPLFILGAIVTFGLAVRPLGLLVASPLAVAIAALASDETRPREVTVFAVLLTLFCFTLFIWLLGLPIPIAPWLIDR